MKKVIISVLVVAAIATSCLKDKATEPVVLPCSETVYFQDDLLAEVFNVTCNVSGCHDNGTASGGYVLETYTQIADNADVILSAIRHEDGLTPMPYLQPQLVDSLIQKFDCWIQQGKLDN